MVQYKEIEKEKKWEVIKHKCVVDKNNTKQCNLDDGIKIAYGDLIYVVYNNDKVTICAVKDLESSDDSGIVKHQEDRVKLSNTEELIGNRFIRIVLNSQKECNKESGCVDETYEGDYMFSENMNSLIKIEDNKYNFYEKNG